MINRLRDLGVNIAIDDYGTGLSTLDYLMRYDVEVSGFPSSHAGHLCLLRLKEDDYPGTTRIEEWPSWDPPVLKWGKSQGGVVGFSHSGWGLKISGSTLPSDEVPPFDGIGANEAIKLLEQHKDKPFCLAVGFYRPHTPYVAPKKYFAMYPTDEVPVEKVPPDHKKNVPAPAFASGRKEQDAMTDQQRREARQAYHAATTFMDAQVGEVLVAHPVDVALEVAELLVQVAALMPSSG